MAAVGFVTVSERRSTFELERPSVITARRRGAFGDEPLGDAEGELERLLDVQPRIARRLVAATEIGRGELGRAADAFGDVVAGQLDVQAAGVRAQLGVDVEESVDLVDDPVEVAGLDAVGGLFGVAVHRIALPDHEMAGRAHLLDDRRQLVAHQRVRHPADQREPAGRAVRVEPLDELGGELRRRGRAELHADRVRDARDEVEVRAVQLPGALADPHEVAGQVVGAAVLDAGQRALVLEDQRLVAGVELDALERGVVDAARAHEPHRAVDLGGELLVAAAGLGAAREGGVPLVDAVERGQSAAGVGAQQVQRRRRRRVRAQDAARVGRPVADAGR